MYQAIDADYNVLATVLFRYNDGWIRAKFSGVTSKVNSVSDATKAVRKLYRHSSPRWDRPYKWVRQYGARPVPSLGNTSK